jgi:signal transduction histidine kinase
VLHRDLHDGLGPVLTSATLRIDAARNTLDDDDAERSRTALARARAEVGEALTELRRVVYGLRPIALDERGLVGALREQAAHPTALAVEVTADERLPELSPAVELAAYRVAVEGIANANRHSTGSCVTVALSARDDVLEVMVRDDGTPPPAFQAGVGLHSLIDRVEELGGTVSAGPEGPCRHGWAVEARLPLRA